MSTCLQSNEIDKILAKTQEWLDKVVIKEQFCPFAKSVRERNQIHFSVQQESDVASLLRHLISECDALLANDKIETTLIIYTSALTDFDDYLNFLDMANALLQDTGIEGTLQLASFHPNYVFADTPPSCASNFTNRSVLPMLHILREDSIEAALKNFAQPEEIPQRNIEHAKSLGADFFKQYLR